MCICLNTEEAGQSNDYVCSDGEQEAYMEFLATGTNEKLKGTNDNWNYDYLNSNPATYHQLKYNNWSPSSCSSCSNSASSPLETQKQTTKSEWKESEWSEEQLSALIVTNQFEKVQ